MAKTYTPVIYDSYDEMSKKTGGRAAYRKSLRANMKCAAEMRKLCGRFANLSTSDGEKSMEDDMDRLFRRFGKERCDLVFATTLDRNPQGNSKLNERFADTGRIKDRDMAELFSVDDFRVAHWRYARSSGITDHKGIATKSRDDGAMYRKGLGGLIGRYVEFEDKQTKYPRPTKSLSVKGAERVTFTVPAVALVSEKGPDKTFRVPQAGEWNDRDWTYKVPATDCSAIKGADGAIEKYSITLPVNSDVKLTTAKKTTEAKAPRPIWSKAENLANTLYYQGADEYAYGRGSKKPRISKLSDRLGERLNIAVNNQISGEEFTRLLNGEDVCRDMGLSQKKFMDRLAFWYEGNTDDMAKVYEASPLSVDMSKDEIKALADKSCEHTTRRYNDWRAEVAERKEERAERRAAREAEREAKLAKQAATPSLETEYVTTERSYTSTEPSVTATYAPVTDELLAEEKKIGDSINKTVKNVSAASDLFEEGMDAIDKARAAMDDIKKHASGSKRGSSKKGPSKGDDGKGGM